jgi:hypothetical protein
MSEKAHCDYLTHVLQQLLFAISYILTETSFISLTFKRRELYATRSQVRGVISAGVAVKVHTREITHAWCATGELLFANNKLASDILARAREAKINSRDANFGSWCAVDEVPSHEFWISAVHIHFRCLPARRFIYCNNRERWVFCARRNEIAPMKLLSARKKGTPSTCIRRLQRQGNIIMRRGGDESRGIEDATRLVEFICIRANEMVH